MSVQFLNGITPPSLSVSIGAGTSYPDGTVIWSPSEVSLLVAESGAWAALGSGGGGGGGGSFALWTEAEIDFGSSFRSSKKFTITDAACTAASNVTVNQSGNTATARLAGDAEWDSISYAALPASGSFTLYANASGRIKGKRKILYQISGAASGISRSITAITLAYTLVIDDATAMITATTPTDIDLTIPLFASVPIPASSQIPVFQLGVGKVRFVPSGTTAVYETRGQGSRALLTCLGTDVWSVTGDIELI